MKSRAPLHVIQGRKGRQVDDETPDLFRQLAEPKPKSGIEGKLNLGPKLAQQKQILNLLDCYGLSETNLRSFASTPNYSQQIMRDNFYFLEKAIIGIYNMESLNGAFGLTHEMLSRMHPSEAISTYHKVGHLKMDGDKGLRYLKSLNPSEIGKFVSDATEEARGICHGFRVFYNKHRNLRETPVEDRLRQLPKESKEIFLRSASIPYRNVHHSTKEFPHAMERRLAAEPSFDGIDCYINEIGNIRREVYRGNIKRIVT